MKDFLEFIRTWYVWLTIVILLILNLGLVTIDEVRQITLDILREIRGLWD